MSSSLFSENSAASESITGSWQAGHGQDFYTGWMQSIHWKYKQEQTNLKQLWVTQTEIFGNA